MSTLASDTRVPAKWGLAETKFFVDRGPNVEFLLPGDAARVNAFAPSPFEFSIQPFPLFAGDQGAEVVDLVTVTIDGVEFTLTRDSRNEELFALDPVHLSDGAAFPGSLPEGPVDVLVHVENKRGTVRTALFSLVVDRKGPQIEVISPKDLSIIGKQLEVQIKVTDDFSMPNWDSLQAQVGSDSLQYEESSGRWERDGNMVNLRLQTTDFEVKRLLSLYFEIEDSTGNPYVPDEVTYRLDQEAPVASLEPPAFRAINEDDECSHSFEPLGATVGHGDNVLQFGLFRAAVWDETNTFGGGVFHYAGTDRETVRLWLAPGGAPLVVDESGGSSCDAISLLAGAEAASLDPVESQGMPHYGHGAGDSSSPSMGGICNYANPSGPLPSALCEEASDLFYVPAHSTGPEESVIYAYDVGTQVTCTGGSLEVSEFVGTTYEGWVCAAVEAMDRVGNRSVSAPIALCLDNTRVSGSPACWGQGEAGAPSCSDGCTPTSFPVDGLIVQDASL